MLCWYYKVFIHNKNTSFDCLLNPTYRSAQISKYISPNHQVSNFYFTISSLFEVLKETINWIYVLSNTLPRNNLFNRCWLNPDDSSVKRFRHDGHSFSNNHIQCNSFRTRINLTQIKYQDYCCNAVLSWWNDSGFQSNLWTVSRHYKILEEMFKLFFFPPCSLTFLREIWGQWMRQVIPILLWRPWSWLTKSRTLS